VTNKKKADSKKGVWRVFIRENNGATSSVLRSVAAPKRRRIITHGEKGGGRSGEGVSVSKKCRCDLFGVLPYDEASRTASGTRNAPVRSQINCSPEKVDAGTRKKKRGESVPGESQRSEYEKPKSRAVNEWRIKERKRESAIGR